MIYLSFGITQSVWMSLRESVPVGNTSSFIFTLTNNMSGQVVSFTPTDLQPDNKWSRFNMYVGTPENLPSVLDIRPGMWDYKVMAGNTILETGKVLVNETKTWTTLNHPDKNIKVLKR